MFSRQPLDWRIYYEQKNPLLPIEQNEFVSWNYIDYVYGSVYKSSIIPGSYAKTKTSTELRKLSLHKKWYHALIVA